ncbi:MAG: DUF790 family protein [Kofleriaceae bacterium]
MTAATDIRLFDAEDASWIGPLIDLVERSAGQPWRVLLGRIEEASVRAHPARIAEIVGALRRVTGGRSGNRRLAQRSRALVLGHPALDRDTRDGRLAAAGAVLSLTPVEVEAALWADLAMERPVTLPTGRPRAATLAAFANLDRIQRAVRRALTVRICVWEAAHALVRMASRYGLLATITRGDGGATILDVTGPLAVFHDTTVYGRSLAALVPLLATHERFTLDIQCTVNGQQRSLHVEPPVLLPPPRERRPSIDVAEHLARELVREGWQVEREPPPVASGSALGFPDLMIEQHDRRWWIEILSFSTDEYLAHRLAMYRAAGVHNIILCVDAARRPAATNTDPNVIAFHRRVDPAVITDRVLR